MAPDLCGSRFLRRPSRGDLCVRPGRAVEGMWCEITCMYCEVVFLLGEAELERFARPLLQVTT